MKSQRAPATPHIPGPPAPGAGATRAAFGTLADGTVVEAVTLANMHGLSARIVTFGATLQALMVPDRDGIVADVTLGCDTLAGYVDHRGFFGGTIGRFANRIADGRFTLDGTTHVLAVNDNDAATLHGGIHGFDQVVWTIAEIASQPHPAVTLARTSPDGEAGFPGRLDVRVTFTLQDDALAILFTAEAHAPTVVSLTNHAIFNLAGTGHGSALDHRLWIAARAFTPVDGRLVPTGELRDVAATAFDFRAPRALGEHIREGGDPQIAIGRGYDHNFALDAGLTPEPTLAARLEDPASGRVLEVLTTEPGLQLYTGNFLDGTFVGKRGCLYRMGDGVALEPQKFPDAPNRPGFASARVAPGSPYRHLMLYRFPSPAHSRTTS